MSARATCGIRHQTDSFVVTDGLDVDPCFRRETSAGVLSWVIDHVEGLEPVVTTGCTLVDNQHPQQWQMSMMDSPNTEQDRQSHVAAAGGAAGAVLASSCCIGPLVLISLGASGPWIGKLTALKPYQPVFVVGTAILLGSGFWLVYGPRRQSCEAERPARYSGRLTKAVLWAASVLTLAALTTDYWAPLFY